MRDRLTALGWSEIEVIDDDLGRSAAGGVQRAGFERMVAIRRKGARRLAGADAERARGLCQLAEGRDDTKHGDALLAGLLRCRRCGRAVR